MSWANVVKQMVIGTRRRAIVTAVVYGLSLSIRFTSATGEEVEIMPEALHGNPMTVIMINDGSQLRYGTWPSNLARPIGFRRWLTGLRACGKACESPPNTPGCLAPP